MKAFGIYLLGVVLLVIGLAYAARLLHAPWEWVGAGVVVAVGIGLAAASRRLQRDV